MNLSKISRRRLLTGAGAAAAALPFLHHAPSAAAGEFPKRILFYFLPNEPIERSFWRPDGQGNAFDLTTLPEIFGGAQGLDPYVDQLLMLGGLEMKTYYDDWPAGHVGAGQLLTGRTNIQASYQAESIIFNASGPSVDQYIAEQLGTESLVLATTPPPTLSNGNGRITYAGAAQPVHPRIDPSATWDQVFGGFTGPPELQDETRDKRLRLLDAVGGNVSEIRSKLPMADRHKLDAHLEGIERLEDKISQPLTLTCDEPTKPSEPGGYDHDLNPWVPETHRRQMDLMAEAMACGITDVGVIQLVGAGGGPTFTPAWANDPINPINIPNRDVHNICHDYSSEPTNSLFHDRRVALEKWSMRQFRYMLDSLSSVEEGDGTLLDNTAVVCCRELGYGHFPLDMLFMIAGGRNLGLQPGRYLEYGGAPHNDLLALCCQLMGLDDETFGDAQYGSGAPLSV